MARASNHSHTFSRIFYAYAQLVRPLNATMSALGAFIGYALALHAVTLDSTILVGMLTVFFISGASQAINDYFDYFIDRQKKSTRPLVSGIISRTHGLFFALALYAIGIIFASFLNNEAFLIAIFVSVMTFLYSASMSSIKFVGNVIVSASVALTFIFGSALAGVTPLILMISLAAFFANWAREVVKDVEDQNEDKGHKLTLPIIMSEKHTRVFIGIILALAIGAGYLPTLLANANEYYSILVTGVAIIFILAGKEILHHHPARAQSFIKKGMLLALVAQLSLLL